VEEGLHCASLTNISSQLVLPSPECLSCLQMSCLWMSYLHWDLVLDMIALNNLCRLPACLPSLSCWPTWDPTNFVKSSIHWLHVDLQLLIISKLSSWELETSAHLLFTLTSTEMRDWPNNKVVVEISDLRTFSKQEKLGNPTLKTRKEEGKNKICKTDVLKDCLRKSGALKSSLLRIKRPLKCSFLHRKKKKKPRTGICY
jgi:hypothetical protein